MEVADFKSLLQFAGGGSPSLPFGFAIYPPLERSWFAARVTPLSLFRENLLALGAPFFNVVVRCVVEVDPVLGIPFCRGGSWW